MFVQNSNKITLSVSTNPNIMENITKLKIPIMYALIKILYLFMLNDRTRQHCGIFFCLQNINYKFINSS
jgi:hypothetical protein